MHGLATVVVAMIVGLTGAFAAAQTTTTEVRKFTVISVEGDKLIARDQKGTQEITVPSDFRFTVNGKPLTVSELKPGMTGTATITTTTTVKPVFVTEVKEGTVVQNTGGSILVRTAQGFKNFTEGDIEKRGVKIYKYGKPVVFSDLRPGNKLTATVVTEKAPEILTERQVVATITPEAAKAAGLTGSTAARPAGSAPTTPPMVAPPAAGAPAAGAPAASLPKTASNVPLLGAIGLMTLATAMALTLRRRQRAGR
jgi:LPXTG-motif cell wall-anchored protein